MTLGRQLLALIVLMFALVFSGTFFIVLHNTRAYLVAQLESHAQDAATSLGLSLSPHLAAGDRASMQSMIDAVFDRGYYREIALVDLEGRPLLRRSQQELTVDRVPAWFVARLPLVTPTAEAVVMAGWRQGGWLRVTSHPGYAYAQLWASARDTLGWALGSLLLAVLAVAGVLRLLLRPLRAVERQALAVARREFPVLEPLPRTRELRRVVVAMNGMTRRIRQVLEEQTANAERLRAEAYTDSVTGAGNRRGFEGRLLALTGTGEAPGFGALMLVRLGGLDQVNRLNGHAAGDELLRAAARRLEALVEDPRAPFVARLQGAEFGVILPAVTAVEARGLAAATLEALASLAPSQAVTVHAGVAYAAGDVPAAVLARADTALRAAEGAGARAWREYATVAASAPIQGLEGWRSVLAQALEGQGLALASMPVRACRDGRLLHTEVLVRLTVPGQEGTPAALFVPVAERLGLGARLDRAVVAQVLQRLDREGGECALNLCLASLHDADLMEWLQARLAAAPGVAARVVFELSEHAATRALDAWRGFIDRFAAFGARFAVDRFGLGASILGHLHGLRLEYLKLDPAVVGRVADGRDEQFFVKLVCDVAHALEMQVLATGVETPEQWQRLCALGVDGGAGSHLGGPAGAGP